MQKDEIVKELLNLDGHAAYNRDEPSSGDLERISQENSRLVNDLQKATERIQELELKFNQAKTHAEVMEHKASRVNEYLREATKERDQLKLDLSSANLKWEKLEREFYLENDRLKAELKEAEAVIGFYADENTWIKKTTDDKGNLTFWKPKHPDHDVSIIPYSIGTSNGNFHCKGKLAREYLAKRGK